MPDTGTINLPRSLSNSAASAFSFCVAAATVSGRPGLTTGSNRSLRSLGRAKARPLAKRYVPPNNEQTGMTLEFINQNRELIGFVVAIIAGLFAFVKWLDTRNRELKEKRYKIYMDLIGVISGKRSDSTTPNLTEQIAAIWFLLEYKEYYEITSKIFSDSDLENMANAPWVKHVLPHIRKLIHEIS